MEPDQAPEPDLRDVAFGDLLRYLLGLGTWGFGGPIASVGYLQRDLVEKRQWMSRRDFVDGVALGQTMPGPLAAQVVMWIGFLRAGTLGAIAAAAAFIAPSFILVFAVAIFYVKYQSSGIVQALFSGIAPVVMAIIAIAAYKIAKTTNSKDYRLWAISLTLGVVTAATGAEIAILFIMAGLLMILLDAPPKRLLPRRAHEHHATGTPIALTLLVHRATLATASAGTLTALGWFFFKAGAFIFGSGLAIVPFLRQGVVVDHRWLTNSQFLDAVAMGLITPGPVVITATFIGYLVGGTTGAFIATIAIFIPIYLGVVIPGRWFVRHRDNPQIKAFVTGATAAAAGAIAGAVVVLSRQTIHNWTGALIALGALASLLKWKIKEPYLVGIGAILGLAINWPF